jgi:Protein of unknown function (DUF1214)
MMADKNSAQNTADYHKIPPQIMTPNIVETRIGTLKFPAFLPAARKFGGIPAKDNWSFTLYDNQTRSCLQTAQRFPSVNSFDEGLATNPDGSTDVWFAPKLPNGFPRANWAQTVPGKGWNMLFRLYGPLEPWFDKTWRVGEVELVKRMQTFTRLAVAGRPRVSIIWSGRLKLSFLEHRFCRHEFVLLRSEVIEPATSVNCVRHPARDSGKSKNPFLCLTPRVRKLQLTLLGRRRCSNGYYFGRLATWIFARGA